MDFQCSWLIVASESYALIWLRRAGISHGFELVVKAAWNVAKGEMRSVGGNPGGGRF
jgi:hypothetical protein